MTNRFSRLSRRGFLRLAGVGGLTLAGANWLAACSTTNPLPVPDHGTAGTGGAPSGFTPDVEFDLRAAPAEQAIWPGPKTPVWTYQVTHVSLGGDQVQSIPDSYLGPVIRVRKGQRIRVNFTNGLKDQETIVHWHGLLVPEAMDGHPRFAIKPGQTYIYEFQVNNRAGTYWFHPHPHGLTGGQVMAGLAGLFIVSDDEEATLNLPNGEFDVPLVIQDRTFDADNRLVYLGQALTADGAAQTGSGGGMGMMGGGMMDAMMGFLGDRVLVNGRPDLLLSAASRAYRLRLLNGSNSRIYKLGWSTGEPLTVLGTDGGLLAEPVEKPYVMLAPGERVELWADFSRFTAGTEFSLDSLAFAGTEDPGGMGGMMGMMGSGLAQGTPLTIVRVKVERPEAETRTLPKTLSVLPRLNPQTARNIAQPREARLQLRNMTWLINGRQFVMDEALPEETVAAGALEAWDIINERNPGEMMDANGMAHPIHFHGVQFQVASREVAPELKTGWDTVSAGFTDEGWKDTVLVMPGER
ncbi:MAG: multicopper oxidase domain-containing protein, partial [Anaerolineales bacterium]|nr:multicopper oxidase domain-containing protein [Anaerolineales bacterium]